MNTTPNSTSTLTPEQQKQNRTFWAVMITLLIVAGFASMASYSIAYNKGHREGYKTGHRDGVTDASEKLAEGLNLGFSRAYHDSLFENEPTSSIYITPVRPYQGKLSNSRADEYESTGLDVFFRNADQSKEFSFMVFNDGKYALYATRHNEPRRARPEVKRPQQTHDF